MVAETITLAVLKFGIPLASAKLAAWMTDVPGGTQLADIVTAGAGDALKSRISEKFQNSQARKSIETAL